MDEEDYGIILLEPRDAKSFAYADFMPWNIRCMLADGSASVLAAVRQSDDTLLGLASCIHRSSYIILRYIGVREEYRGRGIARKLVQAVCSAKMKDGSQKPVLAELTFSGYEAAVPFFKAAGFSEAKRMSKYAWTLKDMLKYGQKKDGKAAVIPVADVPSPMLAEYVKKQAAKDLKPLTPESFSGTPFFSCASAAVIKDDKITAMIILEEWEREIRLAAFAASDAMELLGLFGYAAEMLLEDYTDDAPVTYVPFNEKNIDFLKKALGAAVSEEDAVYMSKNHNKER